MATPGWESLGVLSQAGVLPSQWLLLDLGLCVRAQHESGCDKSGRTRAGCSCDAELPAGVGRQVASWSALPSGSGRAGG